MVSITTANGYQQSAAVQQMSGGCLLRFPHLGRLILLFGDMLRACMLRDCCFYF